MRILKIIAIFCWRVWFYILMGLPIISMFPLLLLLTSREDWYPYFFRFAQFWARFVLYGMGFWPNIIKKIPFAKMQSYVIVANHTSMIDIMLMLHCVNRPFVFIGKKELASIPIFGFFYKRSCILVDRSDLKSRNAVFETARKRLHNGIGIGIFPEGGVPDDQSIVLDTFKDGAFRLAIEFQIPILPLTFLDSKKRFPFDFFSGNPGELRIQIHEAIPTKGLRQTEKKHLKSQTRALLLQALLSDQKGKNSNSAASVS